jgi:hypothetical protein
VLANARSFGIKIKEYTIEIFVTSNNKNTLSKMKIFFSSDGAISNLYE